jgi:hypothetical protein
MTKKTNKKQKINKTATQKLYKRDYKIVKKTAINFLIKNISLLNREVDNNSAVYSYPFSSPISVNRTRIIANDDKAIKDEIKKRIKI